MTVRVLVTPRSLTGVGLDAVPELAPLRERGIELVSGPPGLAPDEARLLELVPGIAGWLAGVERISARVIDAATELRVISRNGTGTDSIDVAAAERAGVRVERAAGANAQGVAELTLALTLAALRGVPAAATALREGRWERTLGVEVADCTVGVVGLGAVGRRVATAFSQLGARVLGHDPFVAQAGEGVELADLDRLVASSDVVTLHCPPPTDGRPVMGTGRVAAMRPGAVLVNTARSALVDDAAVLAALRTGALAAYAVDAFDTEPPAASDLLAHPHVLATPHLGGYTGASVRRATEQAVANLQRVLDDELVLP
jgi:phosphoglycerate dehydrogenase-like enzyme